jgi:Zn ribbon nucleic-acid-binding protein
MSCDTFVRTRCPRCAAPTITFVWHERGVLNEPTTRRECVACPWSGSSLGRPVRAEVSASNK